MHAYDWTARIKALYDKAAAGYAAGKRTPEALFNEEECRALETIGARPIELYDYVEDARSLDWETALLILAVRRDYFLAVQRGQPSGRQLSMAEFPSREAELDGIPWLPRLILKAKARLRGELPADLMYCCGGDRAFFKKFDLHPADFLRFVWSMNGEASKIAAYVRKKA